MVSHCITYMYKYALSHNNSAYPDYIIIQDY